MNRQAPENTLRRAVRLFVPRAARRWLVARHQDFVADPGIGGVDFGDLRRVSPISRRFGFDRGECVDRFYIAQFLAQYAADIHGRVLEIADATYTREFGGTRVQHSDVLHLTGAPGVTIIDDLAQPRAIPSGVFDCIIATQTLQFIYDVRSVVATLYRSLRPGGVALVTVPGITQISRYDMDRWGEHWRFTSLSARRLFEEAFDSVSVASYGNVLAATALLHGLSLDDLSRDEVEAQDADYEVIIGIRAVRAMAGAD
jgi:SAM-dependent methyltransferase